MANKSTYGETLFEQYLISQNIVFEREPKLPGMSQLIDFVIDHPTSGKVLLEVKDIVNDPPPRGFSMVNSYTPIRSHIEDGSGKFKCASDYVCALVLVAAPGSFVRLEDPHIVLGAMYGDLGFKIPFDPVRGQADADQIRSEFLIGKGKMVRATRFQNTRIAALITIQQYHLWNLAMRKHVNTEDGRTRADRRDDILRGDIEMPDGDAIALGVTVWENGVAAKKLPKDLFRGEMDAWWETDDMGGQGLTFIGDLRRALGVDDRRR
jgi:hypothetical protein